MKTIINCSLVLLVISLFAFTGDDKPLEKKGTLKTIKGEVIELYGECNMDRGEITYENSAGKRLKIDYDDVEWLESDWWKTEYSIYMRQLIGDKKEEYDLLALWAMNDKYKLMGWYGSEKTTIYIFELNNHIMEKLVSFYGETKHKQKMGELTETIKNYFGDCGELIKTLKENSNSKNQLFTGVTFQRSSCPGAPDKSALLK